MTCSSTLHPVGVVAPLVVAVALLTPALEAITAAVGDGELLCRFELEAA